MSGLIGYYVHHQGNGHRQRAIAIARRAPELFVLLGTGLRSHVEGLRTLDLDDDRPQPGARTPPGEPHDCLHYVPMNHQGVRRRVATLTNWIAEQGPALMVVDVSVEIAMLARLAAVPTAYVRLGGTRNDDGHRQAFKAAHVLLAPFHPELDDPSTPDWVREKTRYLPGLTLASSSAAVVADRIVVVGGSGGGTWDASALISAAETLPDFHWRVIGQSSPAMSLPGNLRFFGWVDDADAEIAQAGLVVGHAGDGVVNAVIAAGRPFICLPQARPYSEQFSKARRLAALGAAVTLERMPKPCEWVAVIRRAQVLDPRVLRQLHDVEGPMNAVRLLRAAAQACE